MYLEVKWLSRKSFSK